MNRFVASLVAGPLLLSLACQSPGYQLAVDATPQSDWAAAESRIRDADVAELVAQKVKNDILTKTGTAILAQANQSSSNVLRLLS